MSEFTLSEKTHHYLGIEMNIQTWNLLQKNNRSQEENVRMINYALASQYHWFKSPEWQPINEQRGYWLISHVFAVLGIGDKALENAEKCFKLTQELELKDFDLAYAYEAMYRANLCLKNEENTQKYYEMAKNAGEKIENKENSDLFFSDLNM